MVLDHMGVPAHPSFLFYFLCRANTNDLLFELTITNASLALHDIYVTFLQRDDW